MEFLPKIKPTGKLRIVSDGHANWTCIYGPDGEPLPFVQKLELTIETNKPVVAVLTITNVALDIQVDTFEKHVIEDPKKRGFSP